MPHTSASSSQPGSPPEGAVDGNRFSLDKDAVWRGAAGQDAWWWQCEWNEPREVGAILQVVGDEVPRLNHAPRCYVWQASMDGRDWNDLAETVSENDRRAFRLHRMQASRRAKFLRLKIASAHGEFPALREIEVFAEPQAKVEFPEWIVSVSTLDRREWDKRHPAGQEFARLAQRSPDGEAIQAQHVWLGDFDEAFLAAEPRPLAAFLSGNFSDWCQKDRSAWRGVQEVLTSGRLPIWASCGGAQGLAILADRGLDEPWDCPHCRDPRNPKTPIYGHIAHNAGGKLTCGKYDSCTFERGPHDVLQLAADPALAGLPREFRVMESHCGQIEYVPRGWVQIATKGADSLTNMQCLRVQDRYIYAAQFHVEIDGTPEVSQQIMGNFLNLARRWGGYNPQGKPVAPPDRWDSR